MATKKPTKVKIVRTSEPVAEKAAKKVSEVANVDHTFDMKERRDLIVYILNQIAERKSSFSGKAYKTAAKAFEQYEGKMSLSELKKIKGIGKSTSEVIMEVYTKGESTSLNKLLEAEKDSAVETSIVKLFQTIKYIGEPKAKELYKLGYTTIENLQDNIDEIKLTKNQRLCIQYYEDLKERIPRSEMDEYRNLFVEKFNCTDYLETPKRNQFRWAICGSYRRGLEHSGDIDLIVMEKDLEDILTLLSDYIVETLVKGNHKFGGLIRLKKSCRQIDITVFEQKNWYYALMHSTGSEHFATLCRSRAKQLGYKILNTYGLYTEDDELVEANSEEEIMEHLEVEYILPSGRSNDLLALTPTDKELNNVSILCYNIAKNNTSEYYELITDHILDSQYDIVCLQETTRHSIPIIMNKLSEFYDYQLGNKLIKWHPDLPDKKQPKGQDVMTLVKKDVSTDSIFENEQLGQNHRRTMIFYKGMINNAKVICSNAHLDSKFYTDESTAIKAEQLKQANLFFESEDDSYFKFFVGDTNFTGRTQFENERLAISDAKMVDLWELLTPDFDPTSNDQKTFEWKTRDSTWRSPENVRTEELCNIKKGEHYRLDRILVDQSSMDMLDLKNSSIEILRNDWSDHDGLSIKLALR